MFEERVTGNESKRSENPDLPEPPVDAQRSSRLIKTSNNEQPATFAGVAGIKQPLKTHWYAIYCKSRHERQVNERLFIKNITTYLADYETRVQWGARLRKVRKNLLPGYVLVQAQMDSRAYLDILQTPSVVKFVGNPWPRLSWIPDDQVESLRLLLGSRQRFDEVPYWRAGERVEVIAGPLIGLKGLVAGWANRKNRVIVSIDLLQRSVAVEVDTHLLRHAHSLAAAA
jgi:transcription antitermination factor NusG